MSLDILTRSLYRDAMPSTRTERTSTSDQARERAARRDVVPGIVLLVALQGSLVLVDPDGRASAWNVTWALVPLVPAVWLAMTQLRALRRADELQRLVQLEALAIAFGTTILLAFAGGLLDAAGIGSAASSLQITFIVGIVTWIAALAIRTRQAR